MKLLLLLSFLYLADARTFRFTNNLNKVIWVGMLGNKNVQQKGGKSFPALANGGFVLNPHQTREVQASDDWEGRFWGRTGCSSSTNYCVTGDCGRRLQCNGAGGVPPVTLAEITLKGSDGQDFYDISLVDGYNVQMGIQPINPSRGSCQKSYCYNDRILSECPQELRQYSNGVVVACASACTKFQTDLYCCRNQYNNPNVCHSTPHSSFFKDRCPKAYSFAYNDKTSTFTCVAPIYLITFGG